MNIPQIRLQSTSAKVEINTQPALLVIEQPKATLEIKQPPAELQIVRNPSKLTIDQSKAREDMDLKAISKRIEEAAELGYQGWLEGIARLTQEGDELMMIESGSDTIAEQSRRNANPPMKEFNIGWIPGHGGVQIQYDPGNIEINWNVKKPIVNSIINKPNIQYTPSKVNISIQQYNSLKIDFEI